jgi:hypothetical protein
VVNSRECAGTEQEPWKSELLGTRFQEKVVLTKQQTTPWNDAKKQSNNLLLLLHDD